MNLSATRRDEAALRRLIVGDPCSYCGGPADVLDHIVPRRDGGGNESANLTAACTHCNNGKAGRSLLSFLGLRAHRYATGAIYEAIVAERSAWANLGRP